MDAAVTTAGTAVRPLRADQLYRPTDLSSLAFSTTAELQPIDGLVGQARALEAIRFGTQVDKAGFNLFVIGPNGARMQDAVKAVLAEEARGKAQSFRLGLCQQFRRCGQADRHRASCRPRPEISRRDAQADRRSQDPLCRRSSKARTIRRGGAPSTNHSRRSKARPFPRCATRPPKRTSLS